MKDIFICKNCGNSIPGKFCSNCGEKVYSSHDKSIVHIFEEGLHFITHFEGNFLTTLKTVFTKPGQFSLDYCSGVRKKYFKPVSLFLLLIVLYLLFPRFQGLNMKLDTYATDKYGFTWASVSLIKAKKENIKVEYWELAVIYDAKSSSISKIALFFILPVAAAIMLVLFFKTKKYYFDHLILSLELSSFYIALHFLLIPFFSFIAERINKDWMQFFWDENLWLTWFQILIDVLFVSVAFKRFYGQKWVWIIPKALIYTFLFQVWVIYLYRLLVLVVTLMLC
jgi:Protein of unknown function (DUF3667)